MCPEIGAASGLHSTSGGQGGLGSQAPKSQTSSSSLGNDEGAGGTQGRKRLRAHHADTRKGSVIAKGCRLFSVSLQPLLSSSCVTPALCAPWENVPAGA